MTKNTLRKTCILMSVLSSFAASAEIEFNGFASIRGGMMKYDGDSPNLTRMYNQGIDSGEFSFKEESLFALQARSELGEGLSATVQLMAQGINDWDIEANWAYLSYELNDDHLVSAGRLVNPIFYQSEYEFVGYAHRFGRLPKAVYFGFDFNTIEGVSLDSTFYVGDYTLLTKVTYGNWDGETFLASANSSGDLKIDNLFSLRAELEAENWSIFGGGFVSKVESNFLDNVIASASGLAGDGASANHPDANQLLQGLSVSQKDAQYYYAGFTVDYNDWLVDFEYTFANIRDSADAANKGWFFAVGKRIGDFTVTIHTEDLKQDTDTEWSNGVSPTSDIYPIGIGTNAALSAFGFNMTTATIRYDFHSSAALKVDYFTGSHDVASVGDFDGMSVGIDLVF